MSDNYYDFNTAADLPENEDLGSLYPAKGAKVTYYDNSSIDPRWGGTMKNGVKFDENVDSVAVPPEVWNMFKGRNLIITNNDNGKSVIVPVTDTGNMWNRNDALADLSKSAFSKIADKGKLSLDNVTIDFADTQSDNA